VSQKNLDTDQQKAVDCEKNVVVSAGAGSGKTTVLSRRYVRLITDGKAEVDTILTLTFTRKAAAEMNERIYRELIAEKDNKKAREQAAQFENARISTLDSFSAEIVRSGSMLFGIPADFTTDTEEIKSLASENALNFLLQHQNNSFLKEFINLHGFENIYENLFISLAVREFNIAEPIDFEKYYNLQLDELKSVQKVKIQQLEVLRQKIISMEASGGKTYIKNQDICKKAGPFLVPNNEHEQKKLLNELNTLKFSLNIGKKSDAETQKEYIMEIRELKGMLITVLSSLSAMPLIKGMFTLLAEFQEEFLAAKRRLGILSFQDVASLAVKILEQDLDLRHYYKNQFSHIMIDEFQDNNGLQRDLLFLLSEKLDYEVQGIPQTKNLEPDKLFFVGDEKQSIYSFRGADVSVFKKLKDEILDSGGKFLSLNTNYRSEPALIDFFNDFFTVVMDNAEEVYEAEFNSLQSRTPSHKITPFIHMFYKPYGDEPAEDMLGGREAEAWQLVKTIKSLVEERKLTIPDTKEESRFVEYRDICLLMRSTGDQILYEKYFRRLNIPFSVQGVRALFLEAPINDIYNFLQILVYPSDMSSYMGVLRSPFLNLNDDVSVKIILEKKDAFAMDPEDFPEIFERASDTEKYNFGRDLFFRLKEKLDGSPKTELLRILWYESGYRYLLLKNTLYMGYLEYYDYLEELARRSDEAGENLAVFLDFLRGNLGKYEKIPDLELLRDEVDGVQIMTVHKSKGLEFPVVFFANTGNSGSGTDDKMPYYISDDFGVSLKIAGEDGGKSNYFFSQAKEENTKKQIAEIKRILYVALTRAQYHLIISGVHGKNNRNINTATGRRTIINMILSGMRDKNEMIEIIPAYTEKDTEKSTTRQVLDSRIINLSSVTRMYDNFIPPERKADPVYRTVTEINREYYGHYGKRDGIRLPNIPSDPLLDKYELHSVFGTLCHKFIEQKMKGLPFEQGNLKGFQELSPSDRKIVFSDAVYVSTMFFDSDLYKKCTSSRSFKSEFSFLYRMTEKGKNIFVNGQVDLLFEDNNTIIVIDFKTDTLLNPSEYAVQIKLYREALSIIFNRPVISYLFYLRNGESVLVDSVPDKF